MVKDKFLKVSSDLCALISAISTENEKEVNITNLKNISLNKLDQIKTLKNIISSMQAKFAEERMHPNATQNYRLASIQNIDNLFSGAIESENAKLRKSIFESDFIEAIITLPNQFFLNSKDFYCVFVLNLNKDKNKKNKIQIIDATCCYEAIEPNKEKCKKIAYEQINKIVNVLGDFKTKDYNFNSYILRSKVCNLCDFCIYEIKIFKRCKGQNKYEEQLLIKTSLPIQQYFDKFLKNDYEGFVVDENNIKSGYTVMILDEFAK